MTSLIQTLGFTWKSNLLKQWHSAMEMRRYLMRFVHHIGGLADFSALKFTKYNQYESLVLPMVEYLKSHGVQFEYDVKVKILNKYYDKSKNCRNIN